MPDTDSSEEPTDRELVALIPGRLMAPGTADRQWDTVQIDDAERFAEEASSWQAVGASANTNAVFATMSGKVQFKRAYEVFG